MFCFIFIFLVDFFSNTIIYFFYENNASINKFITSFSSQNCTFLGRSKNLHCIRLIGFCINVIINISRTRIREATYVPNCIDGCSWVYRCVDCIFIDTDYYYGLVFYYTNLWNYIRQSINYVIFSYCQIRPKNIHFCSVIVPNSVLLWYVVINKDY